MKSNTIITIKNQSDDTMNSKWGGALHLSLIDPMIDQKNAGIGYFFGVKNVKILAFRVLFLGSVSKG